MNHIKESSKLKVYEIPIDLCIPTESNANVMDSETFNTLTEQIDESNPESPGFIEPIHVVPLDERGHVLLGLQPVGKRLVHLGFQRLDGIIWN